MARLQLARRNLARVSPPAAPSWTPNELFTGGQSGDFWIVDTGFMYELTTDVAPNVVNADPVGKWVSQINSYTLPQATTGRKPTYDEANRALLFTANASQPFLQMTTDELPAGMASGGTGAIAIVSAASGAVESPTARGALYFANPSISFSLSPHAYATEKAAAAAAAVTPVEATDVATNYIQKVTGLTHTTFRTTSVNLSSQKVRELAVDGVIVNASAMTGSGALTQRRIALNGSSTRNVRVRAVIIRSTPFTVDELASIGAWGATL